MRRSAAPSLPTICFLAAEGALYLAFLALDLFDLWGGTLWLKYTGVLLCLLFSLLWGHPRLSAALLFTAGADWFLLVLEDHLLWGVALFCVVQILYALHLHRLGSPIAPLLRMAVAAAMLLLLIFLDTVTLLNILALLYFSQLLSNAVAAWRLPGARLFALGLSLFVCCDLCVGIRFAFPLSPAVYPVISLGMWFFYLPSQVLIALSGKEPSHESK